MAEYDPSDFKDPVLDYNFNQIQNTSDLIDQMSEAGGFTATKLAKARDMLSKMFQEAGNEGVVNWISFPAALCATGTRSFFARTYRKYFHGDFELDDIALGRQGLNRLGNVIVPNECYGEILEAKVLPWLSEIEEERAISSDSPWNGFGTVELCWAFGDRIEDEGSLLYWAAKHRIPIVIPGITDGSIGAQLFMHRQRSPSFMIDVLADEEICSDLSWTSQKANGIMVGGGISKHHVIWWNQYRGGLDAAVGISTAPEYDGSLSGARLREAISWGKIRPDASHVLLEGEASMILPILGAALLHQ